MRPMLGIAVDEGEVCAVLVDADVPALGPFDSQRWAHEPEVSPADAAAHAVTAMAGRAAAASLTVDRIGLVACPDESDAVREIADAVRAAADVEVDVVPLDDARLAFLAGAPEFAETPVLALHNRTDGVESASMVDIGSVRILSTVALDGDSLTGYTESLPEVMDEAIARAGVHPHALVFLDLRPGDAAPARELSTILGVPFVTPHGVPWHRATGAALVAARQGEAVTATAATVSGRRRGAALLATLVALVAILGGGLAVAVGGSDRPQAGVPGLQTAVAPVPSPVPAPSRPATSTATPDPCATVQPASWPVRASDPDPLQEPTPPVAAPCERVADPAP
ncbi:hypothetical protein [Rhodococcus chondri]|uniref:FHA domain-containing protein n=1 Tax=Rhodococcus chondri TaxID=3065941 RepID=A0ABU7JXC0_9NOCA|nr:hypothetical protein [Rhodococcus sp. CC-R104]MEE2034666.1 hypothetical protein [Rhodococcus sp. CC-R104]